MVLIRHDWCRTPFCWMIGTWIMNHHSILQEPCTYLSFISQLFRFHLLWVWCYYLIGCCGHRNWSANNFEKLGVDHVRIFFFDGVVSCFNCGWLLLLMEIPMVLNLEHFFIFESLSSNPIDKIINSKFHIRWKIEIVDASRWSLALLEIFLVYMKTNG